jgi:lysophospholipase L1-like esterase
MKKIIFVVVLFICCYKSYAQTSSWKFDFGSGKPANGYTPVLPSTIYSKELGYGFDFGKPVISIERKMKDDLLNDLITADHPFYFSVAVPEGNYKVTLTIGDANDTSSTVVRAESRRMLSDKIVTKKGAFVTKTFIISIKSRIINGKDSVILKPREQNKLDWDEKLTLEFNGERPCINAIEITKIDNVVTVFLAGNSTVVNQDDEPWASWGQIIPSFFTNGIVVNNLAESGLSLGSFLSGKRLDKILSVMKPGDYLFIEFGHNDQKEKGPNDGAWKSYTERLQLFVNETRKKGGIPVIVTSTCRRSFDSSGKLENTLGEYPDAARKTAADMAVPLIDLNAMTKILFEAMGPEGSKKAFVHYPANTFPDQNKAMADNTHFNSYGAYQIAKCVVEGIKQNKLSIAGFLKEDLPIFNPAKPDSIGSWYWPGSPKSPVIIVPGN